MQISKFSHVPEDCHVLAEHVRRRRESRSQPGSHDGRAPVTFSVFSQHFTVFGPPCRFATGPIMTLTKERGWSVILAVLVAFTWTSAASHLHADEYYMRLGVGLERMDDSEFRDLNCNSGNDRLLYGCGRPFYSTGGYDSDLVLELGVGYDTGMSARIELLIDYRPEFKYSGEPNYLMTSPEKTDITLSTFSSMIAVFIDLDRIGFPEMGSFRPFIGAGIGGTYNKVKSKTLTFPVSRLIVPPGNHADVAWMVTAGYSVALDNELTLDVAWRHTDLGSVRTGKGEGVVKYNDTRPDRPLPNTLPSKSRLKGQGIHISLRRSF